MTEKKEILRRIAERGLKRAQIGADRNVQSYNSENYSSFNAGLANAHEQYIELWQHMLDEIERL